MGQTTTSATPSEIRAALAPQAQAAKGHDIASYPAGQEIAAYEQVGERSLKS